MTPLVSYRSPYDAEVTGAVEARQYQTFLVNMESSENIYNERALRGDSAFMNVGRVPARTLNLAFSTFKDNYSAYLYSFIIICAISYLSPKKPVQRDELPLALVGSDLCT